MTWWKGPFVGHLAPGLALLTWGCYWLAHALAQPASRDAPQQQQPLLPCSQGDVAGASAAVGGGDGARRRARGARAAAAAATGVPARGGGGSGGGGAAYVARGCFSQAELRVRAAASLLALATEAASARVNAGGTLRWCDAMRRKRACAPQPASRRRLS
jgi:hypothetical protein